MSNYTLHTPVGYRKPPLPGGKDWVTALRSRAYPQGKRALKTAAGFCCLGVLCHIQGRLDDLSSSGNERSGLPGLTFTNPLYAHLGTDGQLPAGCHVQLGETVSFYSSLAGLNDNGLLFPDLADLIEQVWDCQ